MMTIHDTLGVQLEFVSWIWCLCWGGLQTSLSSDSDHSTSHIPDFHWWSPTDRRELLAMAKSFSAKATNSVRLPTAEECDVSVTIGSMLLHPAVHRCDIELPDWPIVQPH